MKSPLRFLDDIKVPGLKAFRLLQTFHLADSKKKSPKVSLGENYNK